MSHRQIWNSSDRRFQAQFRKTELCQSFLSGYCHRGRGCGFAHGEKELNALPDLRKTSICKAWSKGTCRLSSEECRFAHGRSELQRTSFFERKQTHVNSELGEAQPKEDADEELNNVAGRADFTPDKDLTQDHEVQRGEVHQPQRSAPLPVGLLGRSCLFNLEDPMTYKLVSIIDNCDPKVLSNALLQSQPSYYED